MADTDKKIVLVGMENPLLDLQAKVDKAFLDKWHLDENGAILCNEDQVAIFDDLRAKFQVEYIVGGATQNVLRICQWILADPGRSAFFGAIGKDQYGEILAEGVKKAGVVPRYQVNPTVKTGTCAALITGAHRSLAADLAAASTFTIDHLDDPENAAIVKNAKYYYIGGFFIAVCHAAIMRVANEALDHNKTFMMNLSAGYISEFFFPQLSEVLPYVDILFGNNDEAAAYAKAAKWDSTLSTKEIALKLAALDKKNTKRPRIVVLTQGADPTIVAHDGKAEEFSVNKLDQSSIVDTNGAGDAFCGGFLAQWIQDKGLEEAVNCGHYAAWEIIQQHGCTLPTTCKYEAKTGK